MAYSSNKVTTYQVIKGYTNIKCILLSKRNQSEKVTYSMTPTIGYFGKGKIMETIKRLVLIRDSQRGVDKGMCNWKQWILEQ